MTIAGNPAPLGLIAFGMTTAMLMYVEMGWAETDFEASIAGTAMALGGMGQVLVAIFEMIKGSSFSFAVFGAYGFFWIGWSLVYFERNRKDSYFQDASYSDGNTLWFTQWGVLTSCFWIITWNKNIALIIIFSLLQATFYLLAIANAQDSQTIQEVAGYFGFLTACGAFYTGIAELVNEEYGRHILPGLAPIHNPHRHEMTVESIVQRTHYDARNNTLLLQYRGLQIKTSEHVEIVREGTKAAILAAGAPGNRVHMVADYDSTYIVDDVQDAYWEMAQEIERQYYLSSTRFHVTSFGRTTPSPAVPLGGLASNNLNSSGAAGTVYHRRRHANNIHKAAASVSSTKKLPEHLELGEAVA